MFNENLKNRQSSTVKFFESAIKSNQLHHAFMFTGSDSMEQYYLAIQIAKVLNCENKSYSDNCSCTSCSWIKQNRHPAVITISPIDYTYGNPESKGSTVISVNQARYLINALGTSSPYHRVIIFTDAKEGKEFEQKSELLWQNYTGDLTPPALAEKEISNSERSSWIPLPIKYETFNPAAPNTLLKTLEEPNSNVTFFFLTRDKEDMLDTIVSRCQVIPVLSRNIYQGFASIQEDFLNSFPPKTHSEAIYLSEKLMEISKQESCEVEELLDSLQQYLHKMVRLNHNNKAHIARIINFIERIERAKLELSSYVSPQAVVDSLFLAFVFDIL